MKLPTLGRMTSEVYTIEDLKAWDRPGTWLAVLGKPIHHSLSPAMHQAALRHMAQEHPEFNDWTYTRFEIAVENLAEALALLHQHRFLGVNLTIPHKVEALKAVTEREESVDHMGAINTLSWQPNGYRGYNTDGFGMERAIALNLGVRLDEKPVIILGAGGAARAAAVQCLERGCSELWVGNRTQGRLEALVDDMAPLYPNAEIRGFRFGFVPQSLPKGALIIQATASGLKEGDELPLSFECFDESAVLFDMIYNPSVTISMQAAQAVGMRVANGLDMLVYQGARALEIWTQFDVPAAVMRTALLNYKV